MDKEMRLDALLVERGLISGRDRAKELIAKGLVLVNGAPADKPAQKCAPGAALELLGQEAHYVSRAAAKLNGALDAFSAPRNPPIRSGDQPLQPAPAAADNPLHGAS